MGDPRPDHRDIGQQHIVLHVDDPRGTVSPFQIVADVHEVPAVVAQLGGLNRAAHVGDMAQGEIAHVGCAQARAFHPRQLRHFLMRVVQRLPHLRGQGGAHDAGVFPRRRDARRDRRRVLAVEEHMRLDVARHGLVAEARLVAFVRARRLQDRVPLVAVAPAHIGQQRVAGTHFQQAGVGFGALHVAGHPVQIICGSAQHVLSSPP